MQQEYQRGWGRGVVGSLSFNVQVCVGGVSCRIRTHSDRQKMGGRGCKNWTFFREVINVCSLNNVYKKSVWDFFNFF